MDMGKKGVSSTGEFGSPETRRLSWRKEATERREADLLERVEGRGESWAANWRGESLGLSCIGRASAEVEGDLLLVEAGAGGA